MGVQPINNVVTVSGEQERDSALHTHVSTLPLTPLPSRLPCNLKQSSVCYTVGPCWFIHLKYSSVYMSIQTLQLSLPSILPPLWVYFRFVSLFVSLLLESMYKGCHIIFLLLWFTSLSVAMSGSIHVAANGVILWLFFGCVIFHCTSLCVSLMMDI